MKIGKRASQSFNYEEVQFLSDLLRSELQQMGPLRGDLTMCRTLNEKFAKMQLKVGVFTYVKSES